MLDLIAIRPCGLLAAGVLGVRLFTGTLDRSTKVRRLRAARFIIERPFAGIIHTDGETHMAAALVEVLVRPRSLRIIVADSCTAVTPAVDSHAMGFALQFP
jgi:diacylglycerol kinase family enzyme